MTDAQRLADAERQVERSRDRLLDTLYDLAEQLEPKRLVRELWQDAKVKGADLAVELWEARTKLMANPPRRANGQDQEGGESPPGYAAHTYHRVRML